MKVLIISPTPTHPTNAGNRLRILSFCELLKQKGIEIHFLYIDNEVSDIAVMDKYFNNNLYIFNPKKYLKSLNVVYTLRHFIYRKKKRFIKKIRNVFFSGNSRYNYSLDYYYDPLLDHYIKNYLLPIDFTHVLAEYVVYSKAFLNFGEDVLKVIDLHDSLTDRYKIYLENNKVPEFYSLHAAEELEGINRSDYAIAIQAKDKEYYQPRVKAKIEVIGHITSSKKIASGDHNAILFVGSGNTINIDGINHFIKNVFPLILQENNACKLIIAGNINGGIQKILLNENIIFTGKYDDPENIYNKAEVVIIPVIYGTGLKIKTIEAISFGKAVVTYFEGLRGLPEPSPELEYCKLAKTDAEFAYYVLQLLADKQSRKTIENNAIAFIRDYTKSNIDTFDKIFNQHVIIND
ncbi:hypothetical protein CHU92_11570 [Flavobacterium cyanobacteriorum]|uniref:Glycosyl transferase family 1 domain-containing protein n=1 Tax=Flavobacterium cyanobacteriorum TaxID=2022802 RepID=A0A255Z186_9FLAO|nr:glycosyltransferase [Flavobacterium cyanobacteriorum]OYQ34665.1 hypothetical protein CHU92_11570 [Flavobacterium cyanobacteriorum]